MSLQSARFPRTAFRRSIQTLLPGSRFHTAPSGSKYVSRRMPRRGDTVYIGMSGGVDSSVSAHLLKSQGLHVEGVFMRNWDTRDERGECPSEEDWRDVQRVCRQLDIKCHQINLVKEYWTSVFSVALDQYASGFTPNPDVLCNKEIKFGVLLDRIAQRIAPSESMWFATGHYSRLGQCIDHNGVAQISLLRGELIGVDSRKDQSYYLAHVDGKRFERVVFPLGELNKAKDVRQIASDAGLATAEKEESMGICFIGERKKFSTFLSEYIPQKEGKILSNEGKLLGRHAGLFTKTIGQSAGISGWNEKWYVYAKDISSNCMYAVQDRTNTFLYTKKIVAGPIHWISTIPDLNSGAIELEAQIRYMQKPQKCTVMPGQRLSQGSSVIVEFLAPQFGVAPGQYLVLYNGGHCLGSAPIYETIHSEESQ